MLKDDGSFLYAQKGVIVSLSIRKSQGKLL